MFDDVVKKFSARNILHDHENISRGGNHLDIIFCFKKYERVYKNVTNLIELDNMWMSEQLQILYFSPKCNN